MQYKLVLDLWQILRREEKVRRCLFKSDVFSKLMSDKNQYLGQPKSKKDKYCSRVYKR